MTSAPSIPNLEWYLTYVAYTGSNKVDGMRIVDLHLGILKPTTVCLAFTESAVA